MLSASSQFRYRPLQLRKEFARMCAVHLGMMKLERHCELTAKKASAVPTPNQERIVENAAARGVFLGLTFAGSFSELIFIPPLCS